jgi:hypothetical protein
MGAGGLVTAPHHPALARPTVLTLAGRLAAIR